MPSEVEIGYNKDDSMNIFENPEFIFNDNKSYVDKVDVIISNRQSLLVDDEDVFRNLAATMRNPKINKHNILDTIADYKFLNSKR